MFFATCLHIRVCLSIFRLINMSLKISSGTSQAAALVDSSQPETTKAEWLALFFLHRGGIPFREYSDRNPHAIRPGSVQPLGETKRNAKRLRRGSDFCATAYCEQRNVSA